MKYNDWQRFLSETRLDRYLAACDGDESKAIQLYRLNVRLAQAFHPVLGLFEVVLRNQIDQTMAFYFNDPMWIPNKKHQLGGKLCRMVLEMEKRMNASRIPVTKGAVLSNQMLGFWTEFFEKEPFRNLKGSPIHLFKNPPPVLMRKDIAARLNQIRLFRNRINHNEPVCFKRAIIDFTEALEVYEAVVEVLGWIDPKAKQVLNGLDGVKSQLARTSIFQSVTGKVS